MRAMILRQLGPIGENGVPLAPADLPEPVPGLGEIRIRVAVCDVCHTELDEIEGQEYPLEEANQALRELKSRRIRGAKVLRVA